MRSPRGQQLAGRVREVLFERLVGAEAVGVPPPQVLVEVRVSG